MKFNLIQFLPKSIKELARDERGVGAIEFAFIFPLLLILYIGAFELTVAFNIYKRTANAASSIADLVALQTEVDKAFLTATPHLAAAIYTPYSTKGLQTKITGILVDANGVPRVQWSWANDQSAPYSKNTIVTLPASMREAGRFFVRTELAIPHSILRFMTSSESPIQTLTLRNEDIFEKRRVDPIICKDC